MSDQSGERLLNRVEKPPSVIRGSFVFGDEGGSNGFNPADLPSPADLDDIGPSKVDNEAELEKGLPTFDTSMPRHGDGPDASAHRKDDVSDDDTSRGIESGGIGDIREMLREIIGNQNRILERLENSMRLG